MTAENKGGDPISRYLFRWPAQNLSEDQGWKPGPQGQRLERPMPETDDEVAADSRWPAFFPSAISIVTTTDGNRTSMERVVGANIVNRFPFIAAFSICREALSKRHYRRDVFTEILESGDAVTLQFVDPGDKLDQILEAISNTDDHSAEDRIAAAGLPVRPCETNAAPVFSDAYLAYEGRMVRPAKNLDGATVLPDPWIDVGSHRLYFVEITGIQLREDIAKADTQINWRSLPKWTPQIPEEKRTSASQLDDGTGKYIKPFTPDYKFPARNTVSFEYDEVVNGMAFKRLPPTAADQLEKDNFRSGYPCFFPSSVGMITSQAPGGVADLMPCGSTLVISRHPMIIGVCVTSSAVNERTRPRASLDFIRRSGGFGCGVPFIADHVLEAIRYTGNTSYNEDPKKVANAGVKTAPGRTAPCLADLPIHFDCKLVGEHGLGTHTLLLGEVTSVSVRAEVSVDNPLEWLPWAHLSKVEDLG